MKKGQKLYAISFSGEHRARVETWTVTSVMRAPRRWLSFGLKRRKPSGGEKYVYLKRGDGRSKYDRRSLLLSTWPKETHYAASPRAAWRKSIKPIEESIASYEECLTGEAVGDQDWIDELKAALRLLRGSRTIARKEAAKKG